jgi:antitoxin ParD1/3/4
MNISFTKKQEVYIANQIKSGDFQNASEVVRDAIRIHEFYRKRMLEQLQQEIEKGWNSPDSKKTIKDIIAEKSKK